jgi:hypothetical protein
MLDAGEWSVSRSGHFVTQERNPVHLKVKAVWAPGPVLTWVKMTKSPPTWIRAPVRPARYIIATLTTLPGPPVVLGRSQNKKNS